MAGAGMTPQEQANLVLDFARTLFVNGQATEQTVGAAERLGRALGLPARIAPSWGELQLQIEDDRVSAVAADPTGVDRDRVAAAMRAIEEVAAGRLAPQAAQQAITAI